MKDYYLLLQISRTADLITIKKAYRSLALAYHPDKNSSEDASKLFIEITEAYEVLRNTEIRKEYDSLLAEKSNSKDVFSANEKQKQWQSYGKTKATEYATMPIDDFIKRIVDEVAIGARYSFNFLLIAFCFFAVISTPTFFSIDPFLGVFCLFLYGILGYVLFNRTKQDYQNDRKKKFNN